MLLVALVTIVMFWISTNLYTHPLKNGISGLNSELVTPDFDAASINLCSVPDHSKNVGAKSPSMCRPSSFQQYDVCPRAIPGVRPFTRLACCLVNKLDGRKTFCSWIVEWYTLKSCSSVEQVCCETIEDGPGELDIGVGTGCVAKIGDPDYLPPPGEPEH